MLHMPAGTRAAQPCTAAAAAAAGHSAQRGCLPLHVPARLGPRFDAASHRGLRRLFLFKPGHWHWQQQVAPEVISLHKAEPSLLLYPGVLGAFLCNGAPAIGARCRPAASKRPAAATAAAPRAGSGAAPGHAPALGPRRLQAAAGRGGGCHPGGAGRPDHTAHWWGAG